MALTWQQLNKAKIAGVLPIQRTSAALFRRQGESVMKAVNALANRQVRLFDVAELFDLDFWISETENLMPAGIRDVISHRFLTGALSAEAEGLAVVASDPRVLQTITAINEKSNLIPRRTLDRLSKLVATSIEQDWTEAEFAKRVQSMFKDMEFFRAARIARTSGTGAFERGQVIAFQDAGIEEKEWLAMPGARLAHAEAHGQRVKREEPFLVGGESLMFPGDPTGSAGNVINCRCTQLPVAVE
jgi:hypothetical protein